MNKYITWSQGKYFEGQDLHSKSVIKNLTKSLINSKCEVFVTMQDYDQDANCIGCPLFFDIDAPSLYDAHETMIELCHDIEDIFQVSPFVWFSGGKGFHVLAPLYVEHPRCHEIIKLIVDDYFKGYDLDHKVYRTRSMFRVENSWNIKGGKYKVPVDGWNHLSLEDIYKMGDNQVTSTWGERWKTTKLDIAEYIDRLPEFKPIDVTSKVDFADMMPCLRNLWSMETPPEGQRHELAYVFIRYCYRAGLSKEETTGQFHAHPFWKNVSENDYTKIIRSVYTKGNATLGCKTNQLLQNNCVYICKYNADFDITKYIRS